MLFRSTGLVIAVVIAIGNSTASVNGAQSIVIWLHVAAGVAWIGLLLFNSIILQAQVIDDTSKPDEIIVKSTRSNSNVYQLGSSVEIISAEEIKKNSFNFVSEALQTSSGVYVSQTGSFGGTATVRIRGASSDQTLVLIDGVPISDPSSPGGGYDFSSLLTSNIDRIEILKGSQSTLWGSDAIGGVINIVTFENEIGRAHV